MGRQRYAHDGVYAIDNTMATAERSVVAAYDKMRRSSVTCNICILSAVVDSNAKSGVSNLALLLPSVILVAQRQDSR